MENWLGEQINQIASQWAGAIKQHYPEAYPNWSDADLHMELLRKHFLPALNCLAWEEYTATPGLQSRTEAMESSKFWQIRKLWIKVKRQLGLTQEDP